MAVSLDLEDGDSFNFACPCLNAHINCQIGSSSSGSSKGKNLRVVHLAERPEVIKQPAYVTWDQEEVRQSRRKSIIGEDSMEPLGPSWRTCWICKTRLYRDDGKHMNSPGSSNTDVTIDCESGILWGEKLDDLLNRTILPFSSLSIQLPHNANFGKPPPDSLKIYPRITSPTQSVLKNTHFIPPLPDPFFLPPPFIPSHPHLRDLCNQSVEYLKDRHAVLEKEVQNFIAKKSDEMRNLEDTVRKEVEVLWQRYANVPGVASELERSRSRSKTRDGDSRERRREVAGRFTAPHSNTATPRASASLVLQASPPAVGGSSLLSASISANSFHAPPPPSSTKDKVDHSIEEASKRYDTRSDARAVAMSYVFSSLDEAMADRSGQQKASRQAEQARRSSKSGPEVQEESVDEDKAEKDSWIDDERRALVTEENAPKAKKKDSAEPKRAVKFSEPEPEAQIANSPGPDGDKDHDEYVFDFELDENKSNEAPPPDHRNISRTRDMVEANLSTTFAADAPSHRAAWRVRGINTSLWATPKRPEDSDDGSNYEDESGISKLAQSMPMTIALKRGPMPAKNLPAMERKTSWSDRQELVPPLRSAMRQQGVAGRSPRDQAGETTRRGSRSASVSRDREGVKSYTQDPGAVFESLADEAGDDDEEEDQEGTLREGRFVPPHVIARKESHGDGPEVGWRSLAPNEARLRTL